MVAPGFGPDSTDWEPCRAGVDVPEQQLPPSGPGGLRQPGPTAGDGDGTAAVQSQDTQRSRLPQLTSKAVHVGLGGSCVPQAWPRLTEEAVPVSHPHPIEGWRSTAGPSAPQRGPFAHVRTGVCDKGQKCLRQKRDECEGLSWEVAGRRPLRGAGSPPAPRLGTLTSGSPAVERWQEGDLGGPESSKVTLHWSRFLPNANRCRSQGSGAFLG